MTDANDYSRFDSIVDPDEVSLAEEARGKKDQGNKFFKAKNMPGALKRYTRALEILKGVAASDETAEDKALKTTVLSNRAAVYNKMGKFAESKTDCNAALALYPLHAKAMFRLAQAHDGAGSPSEAYRVIYALLKREPKNRAARALGVALQGRLHSRSRSTIAAEVEERLRKEKRAAEKKIADAAKAKAKAKAGEGSAAAAAAASPSSSSLSASKSKSTSKARAAAVVESSDDDDDEDSEAEDAEALKGAVRGYKTLADGRKTSYFHREMDATAKALLAKSPASDTGPRRITSTSPQMMPPAVPGGASGASDWNRSGQTWEDRNVWPWAKARLAALLVGLKAQRAGVATLVGLKDISGSASVSLIRGTKRYIFDLSFISECTFIAAGGGGGSGDGSAKTKAKKCKGEVVYKDLCHDDFDDGAFDYVLKSVKKSSPVPKAAAAALNDAVFEAFKVLVAEFHEL